MHLTEIIVNQRYDISLTQGNSKFRVNFVQYIDSLAALFLSVNNTVTQGLRCAIVCRTIIKSEAI